ncbi:hypothetical protein ACFYKT_09255 [Cytobacillus sp. FJAT-53684]|uniref:t-SNARE coiled-coil homology domain-containing protein n=1 Tax=Cytobacillus mangrovibacter TaxID=3299024 RepID=A0ABW6JXA3_9BACI
MEQETMLKEILNALKVHSESMDQKFKKVDERLDRIESRLDRMENRMDQLENRMDQMDTRLDRIEKKMDGFRIELTEAQETVEFVAVKTIQHEKKIRELHQQ